MKKTRSILTCIIFLLNITILPLNYANADSNISINTLVKMKSISGGLSFSASIGEDGTVWTWGDNYDGQLGDGTYLSRSTPTMIDGLSGFSSVCCGANHALALKSDGTVWAWGANMNYQLGNGKSFKRNTPLQVNGMNNVIALSAGHNHSVALKSDGTVWTWGRNCDGQLGRITQEEYTATPGVINELSGITSIAAMDDLTVALKNDGTVWYCGHTDIYQEKITIAEGLENIVAIAALSNSIVALKNDGTIYMFKSNTRGNFIKKIENISGVKSIVSGQNQIAALKNDGSLWLIGQPYLVNGYVTGQGSDFTNAQMLDDISDIKTIASGYNHILILKNDGTVWGVGNNTNGQLGNGIAIKRNIPIKIPNLNKIESISTSDYQSMGISTDGTINIWGELNHDINSDAYSSAPIEIQDLDNIVEASGNSCAYAALKNDGTVWCWGTNFGEVPSKVDNLSDIVDICQGEYLLDFYAIKKDGTVYDFGINSDGLFAKKFKGIADVIQISKGNYYSSNVYILKKGGTVWAFNYNNLDSSSSDICVTPEKIQGLSNITQISSLDNISLALKKDGTVLTWQLDEDNNMNSPKLVNGISNIIAISGNSKALKSDGTVWTWGSNTYGQLGDGTYVDSNVPKKNSSLKNITQISSSKFHTLALDKDGKIWSWGLNQYGELGDGSNLCEVTPVQAMTYSKSDSKIPNLIKVTVNGKPVLFDVLPKIVNNYTFVPARPIFEVLGATLTWDNTTKVITAIKDEHIIILKVGSNEAIVDGVTILIDDAVLYCGGRVMVPVRFISESFEADVNWNPYNQTIIITSSN
ncbi:MAG: hypothetical protein CVU84_03895 [Firmicutes bacterium HGW-Firmicutes-1]|nr:MAG: hypothetical protein CVU84_03895 [Firmicutes bacterium HGW-Firmicutes-1]